MARILSDVRCRWAASARSRRVLRAAGGGGAGGCRSSAELFQFGVQAGD